MRAIQVCYHYDDSFRGPEDLLAQYYVLTEWCRLLAHAGGRVVVFQRFHRDAIVRDGDVEYRFISDRLRPRLKKWEVPLRLHAAVRERARRDPGDPGVFHVNGLIFPVQTRHLRGELPAGAAIVVQDHANPPWRGPLARIQKWGLQSADGFFFTSISQAEEWTSTRVIPPERVIEVAGAWTSFTATDRVVARMKTGLRGTPVLLWVGNLTPNKDPLAVLKGFSEIRERFPTAHLYMAFQGSQLLADVQATIEHDPKLRGTVSLLGHIPHGQLADYFNSADYFVLGSHREGSGFALVEAMSCGCVPVVTRIPSFSRLTGEGNFSAHWKPGDAEDFAKAFVRVSQKPIEDVRKEVLRHFAGNLSYAAVGRQALRAYSTVLRTRESRLH